MPGYLQAANHLQENGLQLPKHGSSQQEKLQERRQATSWESEVSAVNTACK